MEVFLSFFCVYGRVGLVVADHVLMVAVLGFRLRLPMPVGVIVGC